MDSMCPAAVFRAEEPDFKASMSPQKKQLVGKVLGGNFMRLRTGCQKLGEFDWQICGQLFHL